MTGTINAQHILPTSAFGHSLGSNSLPWNFVVAKGFHIYNTNNASYGQFYVNTAGTTSTTGNSWLILGNTAIEGTDNNSRGYIKLYGKNKGGTSIQTGNNTSTDTVITLPPTTGTLALTDHSHSSLSNISFDQDSEGNWGYIPSGADTVIPFKKGLDVGLLNTYKFIPIYKNGNMYTSITGGYSSRVSYNGNVSFESDHIHLETTQQNNAWVSLVYTTNKIDLSKYNGIIIVIKNNIKELTTPNDSRYYGFNYVSNVETTGTTAYYIQNYVIDNIQGSFPITDSTIINYIWEKSDVTSPGHIAFTCCEKNLNYDIYEIYLISE
jgi:hypothetical protein